MLNVRQLAQYPDAGTVGVTDTILLQRGGIGGAYLSTTPYGLLNGLAASSYQVTLGGPLTVAAVLGGSGVNLTVTGGAAISGPLTAQSLTSTLQTTIGGIGLLPSSDSLTCTGTIAVNRDPVRPLEVATLQYVTNHTVASFMGRTGVVSLNASDIVMGGGVAAQSGKMYGRPIAPTADPNTNSVQIATTAFVQTVVGQRISTLLRCQPFVHGFNNRSGWITLVTQDITAAFFNPVSPVPTTPTAPLYDNSLQIANTAFVSEAVADAKTIIQIELSDSVDEVLDLLKLQYAPLDSPILVGMPTAPTAAEGTNTGQIATTAFVMAAISESTTGVASFNGRTGIVTLQASDITQVNGALITSPTFTGTPTAPTAATGTASQQLATCAFVMNEVSAIDAGVATFNGRSGVVTLTLADVTGVGGAPLNSPTFTGTPQGPTPPVADSSTAFATTAFVTIALAGLQKVTSFNTRTGAVTLNVNDISAAGGLTNPSVALTGSPTAPTAVPGTCSPCGAAGQPCCPSRTNACQSGLTCAGNMCATRDAGGQ